MRLVVINDSGLAAGGATKLALKSAIGAAQRGWEVTFLTQAGDIDPQLEQVGIKVYQIEGARVSQNNPGRAMRTGLWNGAALKAVTDFIDKSDTSQTVYHLHNWSHFFSPAIFKALKKVESRLLLTLHDFFLSCGNGGQYDFRKNSVCTKIGNSPACLVTHCDKQSLIHKAWRVQRHAIRSQIFPLKSFQGQIALIHEKQRPFFERAGLPGTRITTIKNPITAPIKHRVKAENNDSILFIGRISVEKGADIAAKAAELAGLDIVFAGAGPLAPKLEREYPKAHFAGFCDHIKLAELLNAARCLIMPGRWAEPFGLVAGEALWSGVPVLIANPAFLAEEIVKSGGGASFNPLDLDDVVKSLRHIKNNDDIVAKMSQAAYLNSKNIANTHDVWLDEYNALYRTLV